MTAERRYAKFSFFVLCYTLAVILWGAFVRASGSGAGCGAHWPLCNGQVVPEIPAMATAIELAHRTSSGLTLVFVGLLLWIGFRIFPQNSPVRRYALLSFVFVLIEAAVGAGIVLLRLVAENSSTLRAGYIAVHLVNTFILVAVLTATEWHARGLGTKGTANPRMPIVVAMLALLGVSASGAIVALGNTLFPHASLSAGIQADFSAASHILIRLRIWHPVFAIIVGIYSLTVASRLWALNGGLVQTYAKRVGALVVTQWLLGLASLVLLAPLALQMAHLFVANILWIHTVRLYLAMKPHVTVA